MDELFFSQFSLYIAHTAEQHREVHRLRYQVYCREFGFEREEDCPGGMEGDDYDQRSIHCLLVHRTTGAAVGSVRLVLSLAAGIESRLPFEEVYRPDPAFPVVELDPARRLTVAEVSRLTVLAPFRGSARGDGAAAALPSLALALAAASMAIDLGIHAAYTMMEPRLAELLRRFGLEFRQVGRLVAYHGERAPFVITQAEVRPLFDAISPSFRLFREIRRRVRRQLRAYPPLVLQDREAEGTLFCSPAFPEASLQQAMLAAA